MALTIRFFSPHTGNIATEQTSNAVLRARLIDGPRLISDDENHPPATLQKFWTNIRNGAADWSMWHVTSFLQIGLINR
jgi:hypothetical protein